MVPQENRFCGSSQLLLAGTGWHVGLIFERRGGFVNRRFVKGRGRGGRRSGRCGRCGKGDNGRRDGDGDRFDCLTGFIS